MSRSVSIPDRKKERKGGSIASAVLALLLALCLLLLSGAAVPAAAGTYQDSNPYDYITKNFNVKASISRDHVIHMKETIRVDFIQNHHGIIRSIPTSERFYSIRNIKTPGYQHETDQDSTYSNGNVVKMINIKIGDANTLLTGSRTFTITYDIVCYEDDSDSEDYLSLDLLPTGWETSIRSADLTLTLPKAVDKNKLHFRSGTYGQITALSNPYKIHVSQDGKKIHITGKNLSKGVGMTVLATLPEGYWVDPANHDNALTILYLILIGVTLLAGLLWLAFGRDPKIVRTVEFYPPDGMTPLEAGYLIDGSVDTKDLTAMIMYFADKGYLSIREVSRKKFQLKKLRDIDPDEKPFSKTLFDGLFQGKKKTVDMDALPANYGGRMKSAREQVESAYSEPGKKIFSTASIVCRELCWILMMVPIIAGTVLTCYYRFNYTLMLAAIPFVLLLLVGLALILRTFDRIQSLTPGKRVLGLLFGTLFLVLSLILVAAVAAAETGVALPAILIVLSTALTLLFTVLMKARTPENAKLMGRLLGFRDFIRTAEYDRLKQLSDENPDYYFSIMPYAFVMGMSASWADRFADIDIQKPTWYQSYRGDELFTAYWMSSMMSQTNRNFSSAGSPTAGFSDTGGFGDIGGGFGGGGFSGGGFGGGGGGAW